MGVILAALFFGLIMIGFTLLTVVPLIFLWLAVGIYRESSSRTAIADG